MISSSGPNFIRAGIRYGDSTYDAGTVSHYWASTARNIDSVHTLYFSGSLVYPASNYGRYIGVSMRCINVN